MIMTNQRCVLKRAIRRTSNNVPEVTNEWVARHRGMLRLIDVREAGELIGPLGQLADAEHVPLGRLTTVARGWDRDEALVVLCRSGGRSAKAARDLEAMGFGCVASLDGGMMMWRDQGLPLAPPATANA